MKKKVFCGIAACMMIAAVAAWNVSVNFCSQKNELSDISLANVEALAQNENNGPYCHHGGVGSSSCSISAGITLPIIGGGSTTGCNVACYSGYYACCSFRCTCISNSGSGI